jgi:hypothetical protein
VRPHIQYQTPRTPDEPRLLVERKKRAADVDSSMKTKEWVSPSALQKGDGLVHLKNGRWFAN